MIDQGFAETCQVFGMILFRGDLFHAGSPRGDKIRRANFTKPGKPD